MAGGAGMGGASWAALVNAYVEDELNDDDTPRRARWHKGGGMGW